MFLNKIKINKMKDNVDWIITKLRETKKVSPAIARAKGAYKMPINLKEAIKSGLMRAKIEAYKPTKRELNNRKSITIKLENNGK